jgi:hypothetical protein
VLLRFARDAANAAARQPVPRYYLCGERENLLTAKRRSHSSLERGLGS